MKKKRRYRDEPDDVNRWVVPYADFVTLLFAFFTVLYAVSKVDIEKLEKFSGSMKSAFKAKDTASKAIFEEVKPLNYADIELEKMIKAEFDRLAGIESIAVYREGRGVTVSIGDSVLFESASTAIKEDAKGFFTVLTALLQKTRNKIIIEGHSDNIPIRDSRFASNWELSALRATSVLMHLLRWQNNSPERFSAAGYGEYKPIVSNSTVEGRARNRRVDILFVTKNE